MIENQNDPFGCNRRDFLKSGSFATLMTMMGGVELLAQTEATPGSPSAATTATFKVAVIGLGTWGREIINTFALLPQADIAVICDTFPSALRRAGKDAPGAKQTADYTTILSNKEITAVVVATPTHQHKEIALAALKAGKHVYCETPLANTIEDAREIALAAKAAGHQVFQSGLQMRSDPQSHFLLPFIRSGALGQFIMARAQWHKKTSWRATASTPEREQALNWRLNKSVSLGLVGEVGTQQIDITSWFMNANPVAVTGFGSVLFYKDGRDVPDTVQAVLEYPGGVKLSYDATLANSFDADYQMIYGSDAAVMMRENKAWMFKEVDSPLLGWEVYARKETFYKETGIALLADASKGAVAGVKEEAPKPFTTTPLHHALSAFTKKCAAVDDFIANFGSDDPAALQSNLASSHLSPTAGYLEGFHAAVTAVKANEAVNTGQRIVLKPEWYELG
ncbi:Oxidoreductase domain protein [Verrucomicrobia bacterium]|nr:Oxidoreductase domain protein [Verrucomicrobiota bacterium]